VAVTVFEALDRAVEAGDATLSATALVGRGKKATELLRELLDRGLLEKTGGKRPRYKLTAAGRAVWEHEASAERRRQVQEREQEQARLAELSQQISELAEQQRQQLESLEERITDRVEELVEKIHGDDTLTSAPPPPDESYLWRVTYSAYEKILAESPRQRGPVQIPQLTDAVRFSFPTMTPVEFHAFLQEWRREDKLKLQPCPEPCPEPRAEEGIPTDDGLLFYVTLTAPLDAPPWSASPS
jgi:hypothetical protein